ncbi:hypothetical protein IEO21_06302 [Rhodonia placenta]|uniref:Uncharacterized protein n=1 Tax=Rhodonia placenta TaxID=104341 RepID=A0A8H7P0J5_9APHY|nr:hypothetical protein IEO21_06302 [Postia placenta]
MHVSNALLAHVVLATLVVAACDSDHPVSLCCSGFGPASSFSYVLQDICDTTVPDQSLDVGAGCESGVPCEGSQYEGLYSVCCAETLYCPSASTDGSYGYNCTGTWVEG